MKFDKSGNPIGSNKGSGKPNSPTIQMPTYIKQPIGKGISSGEALRELRKKQSTSLAVSEEQEQQRKVLIDMIAKVDELNNEITKLKNK